MLAGIWLGMAVFFTFGAGPMFFREPMLAVFKQAGAVEPKQYSGMAAMLILERYFWWHLACGAGFMSLLACQRFLVRESVGKATLVLSGTVVAMGLVSGLYFQPRLHLLHQQKYDSTLSAGVRETAGKQFMAAHGISQSANLIALFCLVGLFVACWKDNGGDQPAARIN
ncbi:MAG: DUF4149 domain-containing protein [Verrucomicrobiota bacterium]